MRLVQVTIPAGKRKAILEVLDEEGIDYVVNDETSGREYIGVVTFPLPTNAVEPVLAKLREDGVDEDAYTVVLDAETVISRRFDQLSERYEEKEADETGGRIAREELHARAQELAPDFTVYVVMTAVSAVVATAGLLLDSPATVVGSMVIAPLIGPAMSTSVGSVVDDDEMFRYGLKLQVLGLVLTVLAAAAFALLVKTTNIVPPGTDITTIGEIEERLAPDFLSLAIALGAGIAGAVSLAAGVSAAIVGVMIAVALVPPAAIIGIGAAWGMPMVSLGSGVLTLVNGLSINFAALAVLWYAGYRPQSLFRMGEARSATLERIGVLLAAILLLSAFLGAVSLASFQTATFEQDANQEIEAIVEEGGQYASLSVFDVSVTYGNSVVFREPQTVSVTVGRPSAEEFPNLASEIKERIASRTGKQVEVHVRFVETASA